MTCRETVGSREKYWCAPIAKRKHTGFVCLWMQPGQVNWIGIDFYHKITLVEWTKWFLAWLDLCVGFSGAVLCYFIAAKWKKSYRERCIVPNEPTFGPHSLLQCRLTADVFWLCFPTMRLQKPQMNPSWVIYYLCWQFWSVWKFHSLSQSRPVIEPNNFVSCLSPLNKQCCCNLHLIGSLCFGW